MLTALFFVYTLGDDCYNDNEMPMPLAANTASGDTEYLAVTGCLADNTLYMGGYTMAADVLGGRTPPLPVLTAIDLK